MIRVLFVCHGNICRSTMAEAMMKYMTENKGISEKYYIDSAATSTEAVGYMMYSPAVRKLKQYGIPAGDHVARQVRKADYNRFDYIIGMDRYNIRDLQGRFNDDPEGKVHKMMSFVNSDRDVADPWYTGDFEAT
ncbi:MAG: low molecular weight phosphotyrosine protein phosphatase [Erysipelotrichaceae bacterium]|nr:low molecular weight phosphotyrosine protein phosphatase [Erysipelotrichaceae bacterium]